MAHMLPQIMYSTSIMQQIFRADICLTCEELAVYCESFKFQLSVIAVNSECIISVSVYRQGKFNSCDQLPNVEPNNLQKNCWISSGFLLVNMFARTAGKQT